MEGGNQTPSQKDCRKEKKEHNAMQVNNAKNLTQESNTDTWKAKKKALKHEICNYFISLGYSKDDLIKACNYIRFRAEIQVQQHVLKELAIARVTSRDITPIRYKNCNHKKIADWINTYAILYKESLDYINNQRLKFPSNSEGEILICCDRIMLIQYSNKQKSDFAPNIPGKKEIGRTLNGQRWDYPIDQKETLIKLKPCLPIFTQIDG